MLLTIGLMMLIVTALVAGFAYLLGNLNGKRGSFKVDFPNPLLFHHVLELDTRTGILNLGLIHEHPENVDAEDRWVPTEADVEAECNASQTRIANLSNQAIRHTEAETRKLDAEAESIELANSCTRAYQAKLLQDEPHAKAVSLCQQLRKEVECDGQHVQPATAAMSVEEEVREQFRKILEEEAGIKAPLRVATEAEAQESAKLHSQGCCAEL